MTVTGSWGTAWVEPIGPRINSLMIMIHLLVGALGRAFLNVHTGVWGVGEGLPLAWGATVGGRESEVPSSIPQSELDLGIPTACLLVGRRVSFINNPIYEDIATTSLPGNVTEDSSPILQGEYYFPFHR